MLGRRVKCPACSNGFTAVDPAAAPPPADDNPFGAMGSDAPPSHFSFDPDAEVRKTKIPGARGAWKVVRFGLRCVSLSMFCHLTVLVSLVIVVGLAINEVRAEEEARASGVPSQTMVKELVQLTNGYILLGYGGCAGFLTLVSVIAGFVGMGLCIAAPSEGGMKVLAILALVGAVVSMLGNCGLFVPILNLIIGPLVVLVSFAANVLFVFFLRSCALSLQNPGLARSFIWLLVFQILVVVVCIGTVIMLIVAIRYFPEFNFTPRQAQEMGLGIVIAAMIMIGSAVTTGLFSVVLYMLSVMRLGACIDRMMPRIAEG
jgi:hypothetical protein